METTALTKANHTRVSYHEGTTEAAPASAGNTPEGLTTADCRGVEMAEAQSIHTTPQAVPCADTSIGEVRA